MKIKSIIGKLSIFLGIVVASIVSYEIFYWLTHVYEYDARIEAKLTTLSSRIDGEIEKVFVKEGDRVIEGDLLVSLKSDVQRLKIETLKADLIKERGLLNKVEAEIIAFERKLDARLATKRETIKAGQTGYETIRDRYKLAKQNFERSKILFRKNLTSKKSLEEEESKVLVIETEVKNAAANIRVSELELKEIISTKSRIDVLHAEKKMVHLNIKKINTLIDQEKSKLGYHFIKSPINGIIDSVYKYKGEHIEEAERIILLHDEHSLWVEANVDESQLRHLSVGQNVIIDMDAYPFPFQEFEGIVEYIGSVTISQMKGSNTISNGRARKPTQRIPVRIKILDPPPKLAPGMLVEINIQIYRQIKF